MHSSCCPWGSTLGATTCSPSTCSATFRISESGDTKRVHMGGVQGPLLQPSPIALLGSAFYTLFSAWWLCCGVCAPTGTGPILVLGHYSSLDVPFIPHSETVYSRGSSWLLSLSSQFSGKIPLPTFLVWKHSCSVE